MASSRLVDGSARRLGAYGPSRHRKPHESESMRRMPPCPVSWFRFLAPDDFRCYKMIGGKYMGKTL